MKQLNAQQQARIMELVNALRTRRGEYLEELSEYLEQRNQLVSEHRHLRLALVDLQTRLKELRANYLRAGKNSIR